MAATTFYGTGRRKSSIARVYMTPGTGKVTINKKDMDDYFGLETLKIIVRQPLEVQIRLTSMISRSMFMAVGSPDRQERFVTVSPERSTRQMRSSAPRSRKQVFLPEIQERRSVRNTDSKRQDVLRSSQRDNFIPTGSIQNHVFTLFCSVWVYLKCGEFQTVTNT